jgi:formyl-CoA transferase
MTDTNLFKNLTVLSLEQAIVVPYFTYRLVLDGAQVIRLEHPVMHDPNRLVGDKVLAEERMNAYFLTINAGKKALTLNLKKERGQEILYDLIRKLDVDIFVTNQLPKNYLKLGIDYNTLKAVKKDLVWIGVTGFGPQSNEGAYDPILQARAALMDLTGEADGSPQVIGVPLPDMGSSEQVYGLAMRALYKRALSGVGSRIDFSMFKSSVSWHAINIPMTASFNKKLTRRGNTHEFFAPVSVFKTRDGFIYLAVGNDRQWQALTGLEGFVTLKQECFRNNSGRIANVKTLNQLLNEITLTYSTEELLKQFNEITLPASKINSLSDMLKDPLVVDDLLSTTDPESGRKVTLSPPPLGTDFLKECEQKLSFPPRLGEHNQKVYGDDLGLSVDDLNHLRKEDII